jgi:glutathione S-transferase
MIMLYGRRRSGNSYKVRLLMALLHVTYTETEVPLGAGGRNQVDQAYRTLNPRGQVPTLVDGETVLWGSTGILVYLAAHYDQSERWLPRRDPVVLSRIMQWLELAQNEINTGLFRARAITRFGYEGSLDAARRDGEVALRVVEDQLRKGELWLAGDTAPTVADIACFPYIALAPDGGFYLGAYPAIENWIGRIKQLRGYVALPD